MLKEQCQRLGAIALTALSFCGVNQLHAEQAIYAELSVKFLEDTGTANRIVAGDLLRTLSQEIPAAACHLHNGVAIEEATDLLTTSIAKFDSVTLALLNGNEAIGIIGGETRRKTIVELEMLIAEWQTVRDAATTLLANPTDTDAAEIVYDSSKAMYEKTYHLSTELEAEYANPAEILQSDVMLLEISGRMASMTQRMAYEACRIWSGGTTDYFVKDLTETMDVFFASKVALRSGLPALGIQPAPTPEIAAGLDDITADWKVLSGYLNQVIAGEDVSVELREDLYHELAVKLYKVEAVEVLYQNYTKRVIH